MKFSKMAERRPDSPGTKAASAPTVDKSIGTKPIREISGPSINIENVGPEGAPYQAKDAK